MFTQFTENRTQKQVLEMVEGSVPYVNLWWQGYPKTGEWTRNHLLQNLWFIECKELCARLGAPIVRMKDFESVPGVWIFDTEIGIRWIIWSDGYKKNPWKGSSYEVIIPAGTTDEQVLESTQAFFRDIVQCLT